MGDSRTSCRWTTLMSDPGDPATFETRRHSLSKKGPPTYTPTHLPQRTLLRSDPDDLWPLRHLIKETWPDTTWPKCIFPKFIFLQNCVFRNWIFWKCIGEELIGPKLLGRKAHLASTASSELVFADTRWEKGKLALGRGAVHNQESEWERKEEGGVLLGREGGGGWAVNHSGKDIYIWAFQGSQARKRQRTWEVAKSEGQRPGNEDPWHWVQRQWGRGGETGTCHISQNPFIHPYDSGASFRLLAKRHSRGFQE